MQFISPIELIEEAAFKQSSPNQVYFGDQTVHLTTAVMRASSQALPSLERDVSTLFVTDAMNDSNEYAAFRRRRGNDGQQAIS